MSLRHPTTLGATLRLQFKNRELKCEVCGPDPANGHYWLRFVLFPSEEHVREKHESIDELFGDARRDLERHGITIAGMGSVYEGQEKRYSLLVTFDPNQLMKAYEYQLSFGQNGPDRTR